MKKIVSIIILAGSVLTSYASDPNDHSLLSLKPLSDGGQCFDESSHIINLGFGFGGVSYYRGYRGTGYDYGRSPAFSLSYEQPWREKVGPGFLGLGVYAGFQTEHSNYRGYYYNGVNYTYDYRWNHYIIAARAAYHWDVLNLDNVELYGGLIMGLSFQTHSYTTTDPYPNNDHSWYGRSVYPAFSLFAGGRWYFVNKVALFGEFGYGISYATLGLSFKI